MKVWLFYLKFDNIDDEELLDYCQYETEELINDERVILYAFTNSKDFAEEFLAIRNLDVFIPLKTKMSKKEYENMISCERDKELFYADFATRKGKNTNGSIKILTNNVEYTWYEQVLEYVYDEAFVEAYNKREVLYAILKSLKKKWIREINLEEFQRIIDIGESSALGECNPQVLSILDVNIDGLSFMYTQFGELF